MHWLVGTYTGMVLAALGWQYHRPPPSFNPRSLRLSSCSSTSSARGAAAITCFFSKTLEGLEPADRRKVAAFIRKLAPFNLNPLCGRCTARVKVRLTGSKQLRG